MYQRDSSPGWETGGDGREGEEKSAAFPKLIHIGPSDDEALTLKNRY